MYWVFCLDVNKHIVGKLTPMVELKYLYSEGKELDDSFEEMNGTLRSTLGVDCTKCHPCMEIDGLVDILSMALAKEFR